VWLTIVGAFASPIFLPLTAALVNAIAWRDTIRVPALLLTAAGLLIAAAIMTTLSLRPGRRSSGLAISPAKRASEPAREVREPLG
jgi:hypothetical protein